MSSSPLNEIKLARTHSEFHLKVFYPFGAFPIVWQTLILDNKYVHLNKIKSTMHDEYYFNISEIFIINKTIKKSPRDFMDADNKTTSNSRTWSGKKRYVPFSSITVIKFDCHHQLLQQKEFSKLKVHSKYFALLYW